MQFGNLGTVERKVLGAMMVLASDDKIVNASKNTIAKTMGYKTVGGAITFAIKILERDNFIVQLEQGRYKILV